MKQCETGRWRGALSATRPSAATAREIQPQPDDSMICRRRRKVQLVLGVTIRPRPPPLATLRDAPA